MIFLETELANIIEDVRREMKWQGLENVSQIEPRSRLIARRFGWDGNGFTELEPLAKEFGLLGSYRGRWARISEICKPFENYVLAQEIETPTLDRTLAVVQEMVPATVQSIESHLAEVGLTRALFRLDGLLNAATTLSKAPTFRLVCEGEVQFAIPSNQRDLLAQIHKTASTVVAHVGYAQLDEVIHFAQVKTGLPFSRQFVKGVLMTRNDFAWLQHDAGFFWLKEVAGNRLLKQIEKILVVARQIDFPDLAVAVNRHNWKHEASAEAKVFGLPDFACPALPLLRAFCGQIKGVRCEEDKAIAEALPLPEEALEGPELVLWRLLNQGPLPRPMLEQRFVADDGNPKTLNTYLSRSPIICRTQSNTFALIGQ